MKIIRSGVKNVWEEVRLFNEGVALEMKSPVNQYCEPGDLYMRISTPSCYLSDTYKFKEMNKLAVVNLRTGGLSLINMTRECRRVEAEIRAGYNK